MRKKKRGWRKDGEILGGRKELGGGGGGREKGEGDSEVEDR